MTVCELCYYLMLCIRISITRLIFLAMLSCMLLSYVANAFNVINTINKLSKQESRTASNYGGN